MRFSPQLFEFSPNLPFSLLRAFLDISPLWASCSASFDAELPYIFDEPPWALIKFLDLESGRLFEVGAYSRLGAFQQV